MTKIEERTLKNALLLAGDVGGSFPKAAELVKGLGGQGTSEQVRLLAGMIRRKRAVCIQTASMPLATEREATLELGGAAVLQTLLEELLAALSGNATALEAEGY